MKKLSHVIIGFIVSVVVAVVAAIVRSRSGDPLDLPVPVWLAALIPTGVGLITGGYLRKIESPLISAEMEALPEAAQSLPSVAPEPIVQEWTQERSQEYARVSGYMLAHVYRPSLVRGQSFDIFIFVVRHQKGSVGPPRKNFEEIAKVEFFFGDSWSNQVFVVQNSGGVLGVRTHAWGTFLATCRVTFRESHRAPIILHRYVDFHMLRDAPEHT